jgi:hypothetical protein
MWWTPSPLVNLLEEALLLVGLDGERQRGGRAESAEQQQGNAGHAKQERVVFR